MLDRKPGASALIALTGGGGADLASYFVLSARKPGIARSRIGEADGSMAGGEDGALATLSTLLTEETEVWRRVMGTGRLERNP